MFKSSFKWIMTACLTLSASLASAGILTGAIAFGTLLEDAAVSGGKVTSIDFGDNSVVTASTGDLAVLGVGSTVVWAPGNGSDWLVAAPTPALWTVGDYVFNLTHISLNELSASGNTAYLEGKGYISAPGFEDSYGEWSLTFDLGAQTLGILAFSSVTSVPEPTTVALLGLGLAGLGLARRRIK